MGIKNTRGGSTEKVAVNFDFEKLAKARESALAVIGTNSVPDVNILLDSENLEEVEKGIKALNTISKKSWLLSSILLYTIVYDQNLYLQSGLNWDDYVKESKERLELSPRGISDQLQCAKFYIEHHSALLRKGFQPTNIEVLARAQLALELTGDIDAVIDHVSSGESFRDFKSWYQSFKPASYLPPTEYQRPDIVIESETVKINGIEPVHISEELPAEEQQRLQGYIQKIFMAIKDGYEPAIVPCYDQKEAINLVRLRDKYRQSK